MNKIITHLHELFIIVLGEPNQYPIETYLHSAYILASFMILIFVFHTWFIIYKSEQEDEYIDINVLSKPLFVCFVLLFQFVIFLVMAENGSVDNPLGLLNFVILLYFIIDVILFFSVVYIAVLFLVTYDIRKELDKKNKSL